MADSIFGARSLLQQTLANIHFNEDSEHVLRLCSAESLWSSSHCLCSPALLLLSTVCEAAAAAKKHMCYFSCECTLHTPELSMWMGTELIASYFQLFSRLWLALMYWHKFVNEFNYFLVYDATFFCSACFFFLFVFRSFGFFWFLCYFFWVCLFNFQQQFNFYYWKIETLSTSIKVAIFHVFLSVEDANVRNAVDSLLEKCQRDVKSISTCNDCFEYWIIDSDNYFTRVCKKPHLLVFAKLSGHPMWPAKVCISVGSLVASYFQCCCYYIYTFMHWNRLCRSTTTWSTWNSLVITPKRTFYLKIAFCSRKNWWQKRQGTTGIWAKLWR